MKIQNLRYFHSSNLLASRSGCVVCFEEILPSQRLNPERLVHWLSGLPYSFRWRGAVLDAPLVDLLPELLWAFTEHARLHEAPVRVLNASSDELRLWLPVDEPKAATAAAALCMHLLNGVQSDREPDAAFEQLWTALRVRLLNQTHAHVARAAQLLGVPFYRLDLDGHQCLQLGQGHRLRLFSETLSDRTPLFAKLAMNKRTLHSLLEHRGVPLPPQVSVQTLEDALVGAERLGWPVVLKSLRKNAHAEHVFPRKKLISC